MELKPILLNAAALMLDSCFAESEKMYKVYTLKSMEATTEEQKRALSDEYSRSYGDPYKMAAKRADRLWGEICSLR